MENQVVALAAEPTPTRFTYFLTLAVLVVAGQILNVSAQLKLQLPDAIDWKFSSILMLILSSLTAFLLTRSPLTKSLAIDYGKRVVIIGYLTLTQEKTLEIPFERLGVKTDASFGAQGFGSKWTTWLLSDGKKVYLLLSRETSFTEAQMNEFNERVKECAETRKI